MAKPEKDHVSDASASETNPGAGSAKTPSSPESGANSSAAAGPSGPAAATGGTQGAGAQGAPAQSAADGKASAGQKEQVVEADAIEPGPGEAEGAAAADGTAAAGAGAEAEAEIDADALAAAASEALVAAQAEAAEWQDKFMRLHAEWDTYRRRTTEQREAEKARAAEKLVTSLLPVIDDFERTIDYATNNGETGLLGGVQAVHTKLLDVLKKDGLEVIDPQGAAFDALESQAVATVDDASVPDETVAEVYQKGYRLGTKVLRPAMVTVTTGGPKREKPAEAE